MEHSRLTETEFFKRIVSGNEISHEDMQVHYDQFISCTMTLCLSNHHVNAKYATLAFTETELSYCVRSANSVMGIFVGKAQIFIRKMMRLLVTPLHHHVALTPDSTPNIDAPPTMCWTGKASDLVELIYGIVESKSINNGETSLKEIAQYIYDMFGLKAKNCYQIYNDMKMRKNDSRTYFIDKLSEMVNRRMDDDDEKERARR